MKKEFEIKGKKLNWLDEIDKCVTISSRSSIPIADLIKEIMLRNDIPLTYQNIEKMKLCIVELQHHTNAALSFSRGSEMLIPKRELKYLPIVNDSFCTHLHIRSEVW